MAYAREKTQDGRELVDFAYDVFKGKPVTVTVRTPAGAIEAEVLPTIEQRFDAMEFLADRAFGKAAQKMEGEVRMPISIVHRTPPHDPLAPKPDEERALDVEATLVPPRRALKS
jgi:hypothetical protein